jgi:glycosyltransferase involved in cell wall biosynthesis
VDANSLKAGVYGMAAARLADVPAVWHVHDRITDEDLPHSAVMLVRWLMRRGPRVVIANSKSTLATLCLPPGHGMVASPGSTGLAAEAHGSDGGQRPPLGQPVLVGIVGRIAPWKGQAVAIRAFARAFPHGGERMVVVGAPLFGHDEVSYTESLRALTWELGIAERVEFRGFRDDVAGELDKIDILVHASTTPEPFGQVVVEGMAAGRPVVAADAGGPAEVITHGVDGVLYRPGDIDGLAQVMEHLAADPSLRSRLGAAARRRAADFTPERAAEQVMDAYWQVLGSRGKAF